LTSPGGSNKRIAPAVEGDTGWETGDGSTKP
jgi:hypothetical protein